MSIQIIETTRNNDALSKKKEKKSHLIDLPDIVSTHFLLVSTLTPLPKHLTLDKAKMLLCEIVLSYLGYLSVAEMNEIRC